MDFSDDESHTSIPSETSEDSWHAESQSRHAVAAPHHAVQSAAISQGDVNQGLPHAPAPAHAQHLALSLGVSVAYVQQEQEMQFRMEQQLQKYQLEISGLRYALAEAHVRSLLSPSPVFVSLSCLQHENEFVSTAMLVLFEIRAGGDHPLEALTSLLHAFQIEAWFPAPYSIIF
jgi:hypothetical protein